MAARKSGLGRGLDALFADNAIEEMSDAAGATKLRLNEIEPNREQPRQQFDEAALAELAQSIATHGVIQPLLVRPIAEGSYQLVAGERRWRAARIAGLTEVPVVIKELSDADAMAIALIENLQREDLNAVEEALGYQSLMEKLQMTQEDAAQAVGKSRPAVSNALRLLKLPEDVLALVRSGQLSAGHARALLAFPQGSNLQAVAMEIIEKQLSVRQIEAMARAAGKEEKKVQKSRREAYFDEVELALTENLGRRVKVLTKGKANNGVLSIDFLDQEDLAAIVKALHAWEESL